MTPERHAAVRKWMRILHRDIGFFVLSLTVVYVFSGIVLTYRDKGFLRSPRPVEQTVAPGLMAGELSAELRLRRMRILSENEKEIRFSLGDYEGGRDCRYDKATGVATYALMLYPPLVQAMNVLHMTHSEPFRHWFTLLYAVCLFFLAVSAFWMYPVRSKLFWRGAGFFTLGLIATAWLLKAAAG